MNFFDIFLAQNDDLVVGYLMGKEIFEFRPNLGHWQLFKEVNRQGILADFAKSAKTWLFLCQVRKVDDRNRFRWFTWWAAWPIV